MRKNVGINLRAMGHSIKARESLGESGNGLPFPTLTEARVSPLKIYQILHAKSDWSKI